MPWLILFLMVLVSFYIYTYFKCPESVDILQTDLANFTFEMLREKQPMIIDDRVVDLQDILARWFKPNIVSSFVLSGSSTWHKNKFKYTVLHAQQEGDIYLYPCGKRMEGDRPSTDETVIAVHLLPGQMLIVPYRWYYMMVEPMAAQALGVHDYITYIL